MADRFDELGIAPDLAAGTEELGWDTPSGLQQAAVPVIRRGNNVVLHASSGSGLIGAYGLGVLDRLAVEDGPEGADPSSPRALILLADDDTTSRAADTLARLAAATDLVVRGHGAEWGDRPADLLVTTAATAAAAVRESALKLDHLIALVVHGLDTIGDTGQIDALEMMIDIVPSGAQRILTTGRLDGRADSFSERHVRKAMTVPPRAVDDAGGAITATIRYRVTTESGRAAAVAALVRSIEAAEVAVVCRSQERADSLARALMARGVMGDEGRRVLVLPSHEADRRSTQAEVLSADVPFDADALEALHARGGAVLITARERDHLTLIARRAGIGLSALPDPAPARRNEAEVVRDRIRSLLSAAGPGAGGAGDESLAADLALIEPLLAEYPAAEVAAAALHLARAAAGSGTAARGPAVAAGSQAAAATAPGARPAGGGAPPPSDATTWTHLFVTIGSRDGVGPGDIVGAMTGEAGIQGEQVGKIDIRESHTTVEVATGVAGEVIEALNGRTLKGRSLRVDYDRKERTPRPREGGRGGPGAGSKRGGGGPKRSGGGPQRGGGGPKRGGGRAPRRG